MQGADQVDEEIWKFFTRCIDLAFATTMFVRLTWEGLKAGKPVIPDIFKFWVYGG